MANKARILAINSLDARYGSTYRIRALTNELTRAGFALEYSEGRGNAFARLLRSFQALSRSYDVLFTQKFNPVTILAMLLARGRRKPVLVDWDDFDVGFQGTLPKKILAQVCEFLGPFLAHEITSHSVPILERARKKGKPAHHVLQGYDPDLFRPRPEYRKEDRERWGFSKDDLVIGHLCTFTYGGMLDLPKILSAWSRIKDPSVRFLLVGGGSLEIEVRRQIGELELSGKTKITGLLQHAEVPAALNAMDAGVVYMSNTPANQARVSFKVLEYLASNVPVVGPVVGETEKLFGRWITSCKEENLPDTLLRVAREGVRKDTAAAVAEYRWDRIGDTFAPVLDSMCKERTACN